MDLKEENILGDAIHEHWYYVSKGRAMRQVLGRLRTKEVLDVGAGSGIFSRQLLDHGVAESAICVDPLYEEERTQSHNGRPIAFVRQVDDVRQNLVLMMDVLEHVDVVGAHCEVGFETRKDFRICHGQTLLDRA